jgi:ABC-type Fe3+/spermidine/putrescine transport system ATPase subunit
MADNSKPRTEADTAPIIEVKDLVVRYGAVLAVKGVSFSVGRGEHLTLLGPSGCGKTTTLRSVAGLEEPTSGSISIAGRTVFSSAEKINVSAENRGISMVFQSYAIWPHMTVFENVAYGLRVRKVPRDELRAAVERALDHVQMRAYADRSAAQLSGGQQQRVALARAIAFSPKVILFDEPLSNLDAKLRTQMRVTLRELQRQLDFSSVYVTHDQEEASAISDRVIVMNGGNIEQIGTPDEIYNEPVSRFVADFVGSSNLLTGKVAGTAGGDGLIPFRLDSGTEIRVKAPSPVSGSEDRIAIRTAHVRLSDQPSPDVNALPAKIVEKVFLGDYIEYSVESQGNRMIVRRLPDENFSVGSQVFLLIRPERCILLSK